MCTAGAQKKYLEEQLAAAQDEMEAEREKRIAAETKVEILREELRKAYLTRKPQVCVCVC